MEAALTSETLVFYHVTTQRHNPGEYNMNITRREILKPHIMQLKFEIS